MELDMDLDDIAARRRTRAAAGRASRRNNVSPFSGRDGEAPRSSSFVKVHVSNLNFDTTWQFLKDFMRKAGNVLRVDINVGSDGRSKGTGIVEFAEAADAMKAVRELNGQTLDGRPIKLREFVENGRGGARGADRGGARGRGRGGARAGGRGGSRAAAAPVRRARAPRGGRGAAGAGDEDLAFGGHEGGSGVRLYVGNLNWRVKWYHLKDTFAEAGEVLYANVASFSDGRSKGFGVVEFANAEDAESAIEMFNGKEMDGRPVIVRHDRKSAAAPSAHRVFVGNLAYSVTWADLKDHFRAVGDVRHATVFRTDDDRSKGCGLVEFATEEEAADAVARFHDSYLNGRVIMVTPDNGAGGARAAATTATASAGPHHVEEATADASTNRVYVGNLSYKVQWGELKDMFRKWGDVVFAKVATEEGTKRSRGWGIVEYSNARDAATAIKNANGVFMDGRRIVVREDEQDNAADDDE